MSHLLLFEIPAFVAENKELIIALVIGALAGYLAEYLVPGRGYGLLVTLAIGMAGGWLGNQLLKDVISFKNDLRLDEIIRAIIGSMVIVIGLNLLLGSRRKKRRNEKDVYEWENE